MKVEQSVSKRRNRKFTHRGITQKNEYSIHKKAEVFNTE